MHIGTSVSVYKHLYPYNNTFTEILLTKNNMKRLFTFLSVMLLLTVSVSVNAVNKKLYLRTDNISGGSWDEDKLQMSRVPGTTLFVYNFNSGDKEKIYFRINILWDNNADVSLIAPTTGEDQEINLYGTSVGYNGNSDNKFYFNCNKNTTYTIIYDLGVDNNGSYKAMKVAYGEGELTAIPSNPAETYYFCISEMGENGEPARFKMSPSRKRHGGNVLENLLSFNIQDFLLQANENDPVHYWIENGDKSVSYRPHHDGKNNYELGTMNPTDNDNAGKNTKYEAYEASKTTEASSNRFALKKGTGVSYTWLLNTDNKLEIIINSKYFGEELDESGYYLVGNLTNANADVDINPTDSKHRQFMKKYWFKDGIAYTTNRENADSIVYRATVTRPKNGWGELYLAVFSRTDIVKFNTGDLTASWDAAIRPEEQWAYTHDCETHEGGVDATALQGGLFTKGNARADQALNPVVSDDIESYTFSMNATTSTYRIVFNHSLYIMGPAVGDGNETEGWSSADPDKQTAHAYKLVYDADESCYMYMGTDGIKEAPVPLTAGKQFAFVYNKNFKNTFFEEDIVVPADLSGTTEKNKESNNYSVDPSNDSYGNKDTQYVNFLRTAANQSNAEYNDKVNACTFNLPTGEYFIRLYIRQSPIDPDLTKIYYIIRDRKYNFYCPNADAEKIGGYTTFRAFCDYHAVIVPKDIDVFTIGNANKAERTVTMSPYNLDEEERVLPAETPVILARKEKGDGLLKQEITMEYYKKPNQKQNKANGENLLKGQISRTEIPATSEDGNRNFIFGYKRLNTSDPYVTIGFFVPGAGKCSINSAYITLDKDFLDGSTSAKAFRLVLDDSETTDINGIDAETESQVENNSYYTLQGIKTAGRPTAKGIYVFNGRKVVIK